MTQPSDSWQAAPGFPSSPVDGLLRCSIAEPAESPGDVPAIDPADRHTLLTVDYGAKAPTAGQPVGPFLAIANPVLGARTKIECWLSPRRVSTFERGSLAWSEDGEILAGVVTQPSPAGPRENHLASQSRGQFATLLDLLDERGYPHLLRVWNYLPEVNRGDGDRERYRLFNAGRARAFAERSGADGMQRHLCASSAVGTPGADFVTVFLATRGETLHFENRRQTPASRYPRRYGPSAPSFRRASLAAGRAGAALFVSGTASIVGHETVHAGSLVAQIDETLRNLDAVIDEARRLADWCIPALDGFVQVKVYLRHAEQVDAARARLAGRLPGDAATIFLEADICRTDLLVEIEGVALP